MSSAGQLRYGYVTNGLRDHRLDDALCLLADHGYAGVALTLDHGHLDPFSLDIAAETRRIRRQLGRLGLDVVVETGARYVLDPRRKHEPTLLSDHGRDRRVNFLRRAVDLAVDLGAKVVSFWSGALPPGIDAVEGWRRLVDGCEQVLTAADDAGVTLGFEPEPGMFVEDITGYEQLAFALGEHPRFHITLDIGHCQCLEPAPSLGCVQRVAERLAHVHVEDMRRGHHEHLMFGDGEIDFGPVLKELQHAGYRGLVAVELSRHSHTAHTAVPGAIEFLRTAAS